MQKLYCYVDESGQDTFAQARRKQIFVVAVAVLEKDKDLLAKLCEQYERASGKGKFKWGKAGHTERLRYLKLIFSDDRFISSLRYSIFLKIDKKFDQATIQTIARAILWKIPTAPYDANIFIDGLAKSRREYYRVGLRQLGISVGKIRGVAKDENNSLVRLADALAGFIRDANDGEDLTALSILKNAKQQNEVIEV